MSNIRLFFPESLSLNLNAKLDKSQSHYVNKVMRHKVGETFSLFNESGEWKAKIKEISNGIVEFIITKQLRQKENSKEIWLAFSPIKKNYLDLMIQKTTELGVNKFVPILCDRSVVREININRVKKIIVEASEQSNRISIPEIAELKQIKYFLENFPKEGSLIFCDLNSKNFGIKSNLSKINKKKPICILIGPEGDFSESERQSIIDMEQSFSMSLAQNILRSETAAIAAVTILNYQLNS